MNYEKWDEILAPYQHAVEELKVKFKNIRKEFLTKGEYSPIEFVTGRTKKISSIISKANRLDTNDIEGKIDDIAGIKYGTGEFLDIYAYKKGSYAVVDVVSYGNPIPSVELPYIFDKFYRVEKSRNKNDGGSGLGLAITKSIVTLHGGIINAQSDGEKTIFKVMLPLLDKKIKNENKNS